VASLLRDVANQASQLRGYASPKGLVTPASPSARQHGFTPTWSTWTPPVANQRFPPPGWIILVVVTDRAEDRSVSSIGLCFRPRPPHFLGVAPPRGWDFGRIDLPGLATPKRGLPL